MKTERLLNAIGSIDDNLIADAERDKGAHRIINWRKFGLMAACMAMIVCTGMTMHFLWNNMTVGAFTMDVNPSVEYILARNGIVKDVSFLNGDAEEVLCNVEIKNQSVETAIERTIGAYEAGGYTGNSQGTVLVSFDSRINGNSELKDKLASTIRDALEQTQAVEALVFHVDSDDDKAGEIAKEFNISRGKADCILAAAKNTGMATEELSRLTLDELLILQEDLDITPFDSNYIGIQKAKQIALKDAGYINKKVFREEMLMDPESKSPYYYLVFDDYNIRWTYHINAIYGTIMEKSYVYIAGNEAQTVETSNDDIDTSDLITLEDAKAIALKHAGLRPENIDIVYTEEELIFNNSSPYYLLEFYTPEYLYRYKINALSGEILFNRRYILLSEAKEIALKDSGATGRVAYTDETLVDGGIKTPYYRLVFSDNQLCWTYRIDAVFGTILEKNKENIFSVEFISLEKAKAIALQKAGLENADVVIVFTKQVLIRDQGDPYYHLEFNTTQYEYYYKIDAQNGEVLFGRRYIKLSEAKKIAVTDTGTNNSVTFTDETLVEIGPAIPYYRLVFTDNQTNWTYHISALNGEILGKSNESIGEIVLITLDEAKVIALKHAGLESASDKIKYTKEVLIRNNGDPYYHLEFNTPNYEYYYKIDAKTGEILESRKYMQLFESKKIAINDAGVTDEVNFTEEKLVDGGIKTPYYSFIFDNKKTRWTYRIDAVLGTILEKNNDDIFSTEFISLDNAKAIALKDAGLENADVVIVFTKQALIRDQGDPYYQLEFNASVYEYYYKIDAKTGNVLFGIRYIKLSEAKKIAVTDAGTTSLVTFTDETLVDNGIKTPYYRLVFSDNQTRWTYRINALDGVILEKSEENVGEVLLITLEKAKAIAIKDAGLEGVDTKIVYTREALIRNNGEPYYNLEFYTSKYEYYYKIDAKTGEILESRRYMRLSEAKKIALDDAGIINKVVFSDETLVDGGIKTPYYRLVFDYNQTRWTYRIDAVLGIVLEKIKEDIGTIEFITLEKAKAIAIRDAGLENANTKIVFVSAALHRNQGQPCYLMLFYTGNYQYQYKVDAVTGDILEKIIEPLLKTDSELKTDLSANSDS